MRSTRVFARRHFVQPAPEIRSSRRWIARGSVLLLALLAGPLAVAFPFAARAQTATEFAVDSTLDQPDADVMDDICDADPGPGVRCTLRAAVMQANVTPGADAGNIQGPHEIGRLAVGPFRTVLPLVAR